MRVHSTMANHSPSSWRQAPPTRWAALAYSAQHSPASSAMPIPNRLNWLQRAPMAPETPATPSRAMMMATTSRHDLLPKAARVSGPRNSTVTATP